MQREDVAWIAGLYEGEGCARFQVVNGKARHLNFTITQQNREPLERVREILGFGTIYGPYRADKRVSAFHLSSFEHVQAVIAMMWPWLSQRRREQAKQALQAYLAYPIKQRRHIQRHT